jgi:hypothetical protein
MRFFFVAAVAALLIGATAGVAKTATYTLTVDPAAPTVGSSYTVAGCGYTTDVGLAIWDHYTSTGPDTVVVSPGPDGCFSTTLVANDDSSTGGTVIQAFAVLPSGKWKKQQALASISFDAV